MEGERKKECGGEGGSPRNEPHGREPHALDIPEASAIFLLVSV